MTDVVHFFADGKRFLFLSPFSSAARFLITFRECTSRTKVKTKFKWLCNNAHLMARYPIQDGREEIFFCFFLVEKAKERRGDV